MSFPTSLRRIAASCAPLVLLGIVASAVAQEQPPTDIKRGYHYEVPTPLSSNATNRLIDSLRAAADLAPEGQRATVVLQYRGAESDEQAGGAETAFEDALKVARAITGSDLRRVRVVALVDGLIEGHSILPIVASDMLLVSPSGVLANASAGDSTADETIELNYQTIAARRGLFPPAIVTALVDPAAELALVSKVGGGQDFAAGNELQELRRSGDIVSEELWSGGGIPIRLDGRQLRSARIAAAIVNSLEGAAEFLDLAELQPLGERLTTADGTGVLLEITGSISGSRVRRWQSNLAPTLASDQTQLWMVRIDSDGGSLDDSAGLAAWFATPEPPLRMVAGFVEREARADAAFVALACKPLYLHPDATLGGQGSDSISLADLNQYDELVDQVAAATKRPAALIRAILNPQLEVYRYTHRKTGRVRYAEPDDITAGAEDPEAEAAKWIRGELIELQGGISAADAIALGLADGQADSLEAAAGKIGLQQVPEPVSDRALIRFVENLGRSQMLAFLLIFIGFTALSAEANAPGLGLPGFLAALCFALWFWIQFLAGTAEWLELVVFGLGLVCIGIEIFVVPGFGVFGVGGLILTVLGLVLMSQTFIIPRNAYQLAVLNRGVWVALGGAAGMVGGFLAIRLLLPHVPVFRGLVMEGGDELIIEESEKLGDYSAMLGQVGTASTPLRPSGKARFGDEIIQVVSDGTLIAAGDQVRVCDVRATKVVVEPVESG